MDPMADVRHGARALHAAALEAAGGDRSAAALVATAIRLGDIEIDAVEPGTRFAVGVQGCFHRIGLLISVVTGLTEAERLFVVAHELGHWKLHDDPVSEVVATPAGLGGAEGGITAALGYSPHERKEVQADVFAAEFLCPSDWLRGELVAGRRRPSEVAASLGIPERVATAQAIRAMLLPPLRAPRARAPSTPPKPDVSQREAAEWTGGPLLVEAGPGTGKTRTLVERVIHLIAGGVSASSMLALTFSNRAAGEMRERIAARVPDSAGMWIGTFHAFGREIIAQNHDAFGLPADFAVLDLAGGLDLIERHLERLPLRHFQNLYEPAYELLPVLRMISRCKDEMVTPAAWTSAAREAVLAAVGEEEVERAERAVEFGEIYAVYEELLQEEGSVDFGDLVMRSTDLVMRDEAVRTALRTTYPCVLVDEYQDVNLAGARLLQALHGSAGMLWVVGDQRQSIYRFRGAAPTNVASFPADFAGEVRPLEWNYRSGEPVVRAVEAFAATMKLPSAARWRADRGAVGSASHAFAPTLAGEAAIIAERVARFVEAGVPMEDQVILARSHLSLERVTRELDALGVPLLYLGDLFERPEVRDLLSLVAIDAEPGGVGLLRVAQLPEYGVPREDVLEVLAAARERRTSVREALATLVATLDLSEAGRRGLRILAEHLSAAGPHASPYALLTTWLFERAAYLCPLIEADDAVSRAKLRAIYHLLKACAPPSPAAGHSGRAFLARIRRLEALEQDKEIRRVVPEAEDEGSLRVMTVHASKGLEFGAVHLPFVATRYVPSSPKGARIRPPSALAALVMDTFQHDAEEMALFFVALSRARDHVSLTRAERYTTQRSSPSKFLASLAALCPAVAVDDPPPRSATVMPAVAPAPRDVYPERELDLYAGCPAAYRYEVVDGLRGMSPASGYLRFHACVYAAVGAMELEAARGISPSVEAATAHLDGAWVDGGPRDHPFEPYYRTIAERMVASMVEVIAVEAGSSYPREEWHVDVGGGKLVAVTADRVVERPDGSVLVQRVRTGKRTKSEADKPIYALLQAGAASRFPGRRVGLETLYLGEGRAVAPRLDKAPKQLTEYGAIISSIESGVFAPEPDTRRCAGCQCYFVCGA